MKLPRFFLSFSLFVFFAVPLILFLLSRFQAREDVILSPLNESFDGSEITPTPTIFESKLQALVLEALDETSGTYGIVIKNLKTGESYQQLEHREFEAASLYKLWIMVETFEQIKQGRLSEEEVLSEEVKILNEKFDIASETAELTEGTVSMPVSEAIDKMITISHNYAALLLSAKIRLSAVKKFLEGNGFSESKISVPPKTTAADLALFFEKLYRGELVDREFSDRMIEILSRQKLADRIPKYLPEGTRVAHKTGEIGQLRHNAGIVFSKNGDYIIVVLSESNAPPAAAERIAQVSKNVWEYFSR